MFSVLCVHVCHLLRADDWRNSGVRDDTLGELTACYRCNTVSKTVFLQLHKQNNVTCKGREKQQEEENGNNC